MWSMQPQQPSSIQIISTCAALLFGAVQDPIFQPDGFDLTYAEMDPTTKNSISHRYKALDQLRTWLVQEFAAA